MAYDRLKRFVRETNKRFDCVMGCECACLDHPESGRRMVMEYITSSGPHSEGVADIAWMDNREEAERALVRELGKYLFGKSALLVWRRLPVIDEHTNGGGRMVYSGRARLYSE